MGEMKLKICKILIHANISGQLELVLPTILRVLLHLTFIGKAKVLTMIEKSSLDVSRIFVFLTNKAASTKVISRVEMKQNKVLNTVNTWWSTIALN